MQYATKIVQKSVLCVFATAAVFLAGCAASPSTSRSSAVPADALSTAELTSDFSRSKLIAADFVATMTQLPESRPASIVLYTNKPSSRFGELLLSALQGAGYDLRIGHSQSQNWLAYNANRDESLSESGNPIYTFIVAAGDIKLKRSYEVDKYGVKPAGSMFVRGATTDNIVLDDSIFSVRSPSNVLAEKDDEQFTPVRAASASNVQISAVPIPKPFVDLSENVALTRVATTDQTSVRTQAIAQSQNDLSGAVAELTANKAKTDKAPYSEFSNIYDTGESRYQALYDLYEVVGKNIYVFPNDSLILGKQNKMLVQQLANNFDSETDVMSVIGCSHGSTAIDNGNAYLANNRAFRVKEAFLQAGLEADKVLEEGCWASVAFPSLPARGVLVQHRRLKN